MRPTPTTSSGVKQQIAAMIEPQRPALKHFPPSMAFPLTATYHGARFSEARKPTRPTARTISSIFAFPSSKKTTASSLLKLTSAFMTPSSPSRALFTMIGQPPQVIPSMRNVAWLRPVISTASLPDPQPDSTVSNRNGRMPDKIILYLFINAPKILTWPAAKARKRGMDI